MDSLLNWKCRHFYLFKTIFVSIKGLSCPVFISHHVTTEINEKATLRWKFIEYFMTINTETEGLNPALIAKNSDTHCG